MPYSALSHLDCPRCVARHDADRVQGTCSCGSPLLARYDFRRVASCASPRDIAWASAGCDHKGRWRPWRQRHHGAA
jgi:hypothetical protein